MPANLATSEDFQRRRALQSGGVSAEHFDFQIHKKTSKWPLSANLEPFELVNLFANSFAINELDDLSDCSDRHVKSTCSRISILNPAEIMCAVAHHEIIMSHCQTVSQTVSRTVSRIPVHAACGRH